MVLDEGVQRRWKRTVVRDALRRIGQSGVRVEEPRACSAPLGYRNKTELTLGRDRAGRPAIGFHPAGPAGEGLIDIDRCPLQTDTANGILKTARSFLLSRADRWAGAADTGGEPFRLVLRTSRSTGEALVALRETARPFPDARALARRLAASHPELAGVVRIRARQGRRGGARVDSLVGRAWLAERIGGVSFRLPAVSFLQASTEAAEALLALVREAAGPVDGASALDLYGGIGAFAFDLARRGARVSVCEADVDAVRCGRAAARASGADHITFVHSDVTAFLRDWLHERRGADVVVANPPRGGMGKRVPEQIAELAPRRVVVVSCDAATLARDVRRLSDAGYTSESAIPVDVFPQTAQVETVLSLARP
jgi:23S rRNA (uracil1939-C5)-methyltransferase